MAKDISNRKDLTTNISIAIFPHYNFFKQNIKKLAIIS